ncbi:oligosaccharyl transferase, archaeosortase A system-associated [Halorubellus sp. PRR65]|uniref:oligosaccharyl transferase, archaeosortase A system-associated n=1 Tax=Halorubellus sp. PRR65 TaxID=3098148 RepID=UPI002B260995|nr:oligosaccharyl transferase, archaeosortase A system-associated [Halorubellus sp. PRR65]
MSSETETSQDLLEGQSVVDLFKEYYHVPVLAALVGFMLWLRILPADNFITPDGVYFSGNDAWYHLRETTYAVKNWPSTIPFDPWTQFPYGVSNSQFGTLYDQFVATAALVVGLGDPSQREIATTLLYAPAVIGAAVAIPTYFIARRLTGRFGALFGVAVLALIPGTFLARTTAGFADHHAAEVLFHSISVLAFMAALHVGETEKPIYELVVDRDWDALRKPTLYSVGAGVAISLYVWVWPPAIVLVGIIGTFFLLALGAKYATGSSPDHIGYVGVVSMATVAVFSLVRLDEFGFSASAISLLHVLLTFAVAAGCAVLVWLARRWESSGFSRTLFPFSALSIALVGVVVFTFILPEAWGSVQNNLARVLTLGQSDTVLTIGEAQALVQMGPNYLQRLNRTLVLLYGLTYITGIAGLLALTYRAVTERLRAEYVFVGIWTVFVFMMTLTQQRFNYYLVLPVAVLNAYFVGELLKVVNVDASFDLEDLQFYHVSVVLAALVLVIAPLAPVAGIAMTSTNVHAQVTGGAQGQGPGPGAVTSWDSTTDWMQNGTPEIENMEKYGTYEQTDDFEYPEGAYGVMSWWDYGHWITVRGDRIPHANPFQAGARTASQYFLYENETKANVLLEALPSLSPREGDIDNYTTSDYREMIADQTDQQRAENTRYVTIDHQMATRKFGAIATWSGPPAGEYFSQSDQNASVGGQNITVPYRTFSDRYQETMLSKLYWDDADGLEHYRLVHSSQERKLLVTFSRLNPQTGQVTRQSFLQSIGDLGGNRSIQTYFLLQQRQDFAVHDVRQATSVKTFERVDGAQLTGSASPGANVSVSLTLNNTQTGTNFTYEQTAQAGEDGEFAVTVPYATNDGVSPSEGGTDSAIEADGVYTLNVEDGGITTVSVPESAVLDGESIAVDVSSGSNASTATTGDDSDDDESSAVRTGALPGSWSVDAAVRAA